MFQSSGKIQYDPRARIKSEPWWCILRTDPGIVSYYQHQIKQQYDLQFDNTVWGSHISIVRGTRPPNSEHWKKHARRTIQFTYSHQVYRKNVFFYVDVHCPEINQIRRELGLLDDKELHITVGRINKPYTQLKAEKLQKFFNKMQLPRIGSNLTLLPLITPWQQI